MGGRGEGGPFRSVLAFLYPPAIPEQRTSNSAARTAGAGCPPDAVHVVLCVLRNVVVDDEVDGGDIETTAGYVGGDEDLPLPCLELVQRAQSLGLRHLPVQAGRAKSEVAKEVGRSSCRGAGGHEDDRRLARKLVEHEGKVDVLVLCRDEEVLLDEAVFHVGGGC